MNGGAICIFCEIVAGRAPGEIIYTDKHNIAFLPLEQELFGHALVLTKGHYETLLDMPLAVAADLMGFVQKLAILYEMRLGSKEFNLLAACGVAAQQSVRHFHFHYFPRFRNDGLNTWPRLPGPPNHRRSEFFRCFTAI